MAGSRMVFVVMVGALLTLVMGNLVVHFGATAACPDWPFCFNRPFPTASGVVWLHHGHRILAALVGVCTLVLTLRTLPKDARTRRLGYASVLAVLVQGALISRAGVLLSIERRTGMDAGVEPALLAASAMAVALLVLLGASRLAKDAPAAGMSLLACELVEVQSSFGAAMVFFGPRLETRMGHYLAFLMYLVVLGTIASILARHDDVDSEDDQTRQRRYLAIGAVMVVMLLGAHLRRAGIHHDCHGLLMCGAARSAALWLAHGLGGIVVAALTTLWLRRDLMSKPSRSLMAMVLLVIGSGLLLTLGPEHLGMMLTHSVTAAVLLLFLIVHRAGSVARAEPV